MQKTTFLQTRTIAAGTNLNFDAPPHPSKGLLAGYLFRVNCTLTAASNVTPTYIEWRDTILDTLFPNIQVFAPRYNNQLCSGNLSGRFWAEMYEDKYKNSIPMEVNDLPVNTGTTQQITTGGLATQIDLPFLFDEPELGADRYHFCPPSSLFRGDVTANFSCPAALTVTVQSIVITMSAATVRWVAVTVPGDIARVPVKHRYEVRSVNSDSIDVGRGFPLYISDRRAPGTTVSYDIIVDGENQNGGQVNGEDLMATYRALNEDVAPEATTRTPLAYIGTNTPYSMVDFVQRSYGLKLYGASSATLLLHFADPADDALKRNVAQALGIDPSQAVAVPASPNTAPLGSVHYKLGQNGPRTLLVSRGGKLDAPSGSARTVPTVPAGTQGAAMATAIKGS